MVRGDGQRSQCIGYISRDKNRNQRNKESWTVRMREEEDRERSAHKTGR